ncbi:hypothetical protein BN903_34 [Halorubrum sp. AJ67]|nr:hypothetical protein BN903_34 [Halorubrum sp. AJ67]
MRMTWTWTYVTIRAPSDNNCWFRPLKKEHYEGSERSVSA